MDIIHDFSIIEHAMIQGTTHVSHIQPSELNYQRILVVWSAVAFLRSRTGQDSDQQEPAYTTLTTLPSLVWHRAAEQDPLCRIVALSE